MRRDNTKIALNILTDITVPPVEALRRVAALSKRWTPINRGFVVGMGFDLREYHQRQMMSEADKMRWADDGGAA